MFSEMTDKEINLWMNFGSLYVMAIIAMIVITIRVKWGERQARQERARRAQRDAASVKAQPQERHDV